MHCELWTSRKLKSVASRRSRWNTIWKVAFVDLCDRSALGRLTLDFKALLEEEKLSTKDCQPIPRASADMNVEVPLAKKAQLANPQAELRLLPDRCHGVSTASGWIVSHVDSFHLSIVQESFFAVDAASGTAGNPLAAIRKAVSD